MSWLNFWSTGDQKHNMFRIIFVIFGSPLGDWLKSEIAYAAQCGGNAGDLQMAYGPLLLNELIGWL